MKEANCLEGEICPTPNEADDLCRGTEPKLIARLIWRALPEIIRSATFEKLTWLLLFKDLIGKGGARKWSLVVWSYVHMNKCHGKIYTMFRQACVPIMASVCCVWVMKVGLKRAGKRRGACFVTGSDTLTIRPAFPRVGIRATRGISTA